MRNWILLLPLSFLIMLSDKFFCKVSLSSSLPRIVSYRLCISGSVNFSGKQIISDGYDKNLARTLSKASQ
jgi:hypothetical protein